MILHQSEAKLVTIDALLALPLALPLPLSLPLPLPPPSLPLSPDGAIGEPGPLQALLTSPVLTRIGAKYKRSPEEVALRWCIQNGASVSVRPTTEFALGSSVCRDDGVCAAGLGKRAQVFSWALAEAEMDELNTLTSPDGNPTLFSSSGCPGAFVMPKK